MRTASTARLAIAVLLTAGMAACGGAGGGGTDVAAGEELFVQNCSACHGVEAQGTDQGPPLIHQVYVPSHHPDESFHRAVAFGVVPHHWDFGPMPPLPGLSTDEVDEIIAYVRGLQRDAGLQ